MSTSDLQVEDSKTLRNRPCNPTDVGGGLSDSVKSTACRCRLDFLLGYPKYKRSQKQGAAKQTRTYYDPHYRDSQVGAPCFRKPPYQDGLLGPLVQSYLIFNTEL